MSKSRTSARIAALLSGVMLLLFALTMTVALGIKAPVDFSVLTASAGAFVLAEYGAHPLSVDAFETRRVHDPQAGALSTRIKSGRL